MQARFIISDIQTNSTYFKDKFISSYRTNRSNKNDSPVKATKPSAMLHKINKRPFSYPYFLNNEARKQNRRIDGIFLLFRACFRPIHRLLKDKTKFRENKTPPFQNKTKTFDSKDFVLALLTLRFLEKRRCFPTVKTPSFSGRFSMCLQDIEIQSFA